MIKDKVVIVTGASKGIGAEISVSLIKQGAIVVMAARDKNAMLKLTSGLSGKFTIQETDMSLAMLLPIP